MMQSAAYFYFITKRSISSLLSVPIEKTTLRVKPDRVNCPAFGEGVSSINYQEYMTARAIVSWLFLFMIS